MIPHYLRSTFFYFACMIALLVFVTLIYALLTFKRRDDRAKENSAPNIKVELLWTLIPFIMIVLMALPVIKAFYRENASVVKIQTRWKMTVTDNPRLGRLEYSPPSATVGAIVHDFGASK